MGIKARTRSNRQVRNELPMEVADQGDLYGPPAVEDVSAPHYLRKQWSIFRVPVHVREVDEKAYDPRVVSIGPFHRDDPKLRAMEPQKVRFYERLTERMGKLGLDVGLEAAVKRMESRSRSCYSEEFEDISSDEFVQMMVLDGVFVVELLRLYHKSTQVEMGTPVKEPIFATRWMLPNITRDLLMLENQLPMFVLDEIFLLTTFEDDVIPLKELALLFFSPLRPQKGDGRDNKPNTNRHHHHLLSLFHSSFVPREYRPSRSSSGARWNRREKLPGKLWVHEARRLKMAGIRFRNNPGNLLNIEFSKRELRIPTLFIDHCTGPILRNLLAYEQCNAFSAPYFTCYAVFLNSLIDQQEDIQILQDAGIIMQSVGGCEQVVDLINSITKELVFDMHDMNDCYIARQIEDINTFCRSWISKCISLSSRVDFISMLLSFIFPSLR
ncbi:hypothetical protein MLD38_014453 [Melastoma candidum]|uniref:Uncharacterized protein n=1 Tax=Melastoma candidum TaxID=119954 RepID=A0ACB9RCR3_9MYRT|nr:hypothetical protein MLD38_014453 [Melastoma candidum]